MEVRIVSQLVCPTCESDLALERFPDTESPDTSNTVVEGALVCGQCRVWYPISRGVPVLLAFATPFHSTFASNHAGALERLSGYTAPKGAPKPGEDSVRQTFGEEWAAAKETDLSFIYSLDDLKALNSEVWLKWTKGDDHGGAIEAVLEVGCGGGFEPRALREVLDAEIFAVDLTFALLDRREDRSSAGIHFVVASLFDLPFRRSSFDLVYSQGALHHTYSTHDALAEVASYVREDGYMFVWLYGLDDHLAIRGTRGLRRRVSVVVERPLRPLVSRASPPARRTFFDAASRLAHPIVKSTTRHGATWELENTNHYLRDWLSPRYAHRHGYNEVIEWFENSGFDIIDVQSPSGYRRLFERELWGVGLTGKRRARGKLLTSVTEGTASASGNGTPESTPS